LHRNCKEGKTQYFLLLNKTSKNKILIYISFLYLIPHYNIKNDKNV